VARAHAPCAVISGRARADVAERVAAIPLVAVVGNHGAEGGHGPLEGPVQELVASWYDRLTRALADMAGVEVEDKGFSLAVHHRRAASPREALERIRAALARLEGAATAEGLAVVDVLPASAPEKGDALRSLRRRLHASLVVFVGDDQTDEAAFRCEAVDVGIRVGEGPRSAARWFIADQREVDALLRALVLARVRRDGYTGSSEGVLGASKP
jgi:trehalose 6-phosphate phosphatase